MKLVTGSKKRPKDCLQPIIIAITREQTNNTIVQSNFLAYIIFYSPFNISKLFIKFII